MQFESYSPDQSTWTDLAAIKACLDSASFHLASEIPGEWKSAAPYVNEAGRLLALNGWRNWMVDVLFKQQSFLVDRAQLNDAWLTAVYALGATESEKN